jgi:hypothetical protein
MEVAGFGCRALRSSMLLVFHLSSFIFFSDDDADRFRMLGKPYGCAVCQPWIYLRLEAYGFVGLSEGA